MYFVALTFLSAFALSLAGYFLHTRSQIRSSYDTSGPRTISDWIERRNRTGLLVVFIVLIVFAFVEALIPDFAYSIQDLQTQLNAGLPEWGIIFLQGGSISWALYLSLLTGFGVGQAVGTVVGCRQYSRTQAFGFGEVI